MVWMVLLKWLQCISQQVALLSSKQCAEITVAEENIYVAGILTVSGTEYLMCTFKGQTQSM